MFIEVDYGTSANKYYILNPLFLYIAQAWLEQGQRIAKAFGITLTD